MKRMCACVRACVYHIDSDKKLHNVYIDNICFLLFIDSNIDKLFEINFLCYLILSLSAFRFEFCDLCSYH